MNNFELYDAVRSLTDLSTIEDVITAATFAKQDVLRHNIERAIEAAQEAGFKVSFEVYREDGVEVTTDELTLPKSELDWGVWFK